MRSLPLILLLGIAALAGVLVWSLNDARSGTQGDLVPLPAGDVEHGRRAFLAQGCALCHLATGEDAFPTPASVASGPEIGGLQSAWSGGDIARAIIDPSHDVPPEFGVGRTNEEGETVSQMADYGDALTVQDLADLIAYVRYLGE